MNKEIAILDKDYEIAAVYNGGIAGILEDITTEATATVFDMEAVDGRAGAASMAHKVSKSKVALDNLGKELTKDWKAKAKVVDAERKTVRDTLDALRDKVRAPLTQWEADKQAAEDASALAEQIEGNHAEAIEIDALFNRERDIAAREAELAAAQATQEREAEHRRQEEAREAENARKITLARIQAEQDAQKKIDDAEAEAQRKIAEANKIAAQAVETANIEAEQRLQQARDAEAAIKREEQAAAQTMANKRKINKAAKDAFMADGFDDKQAERIIKLIANGRIPGVAISYMRPA